MGNNLYNLTYEEKEKEKEIRKILKAEADLMRENTIDVEPRKCKFPNKEIKKKNKETKKRKTWFHEITK